MNKYGSFLLLLFCHYFDIISGNYYGVDPLQLGLSPLSQSTGLLYIIEGIRLPTGRITEFKVFYDTRNGRPSTFRLQIYRSEPSNQQYEFTLIGEKLVTSSEVPANIQAERTIPLRSDEYINTQNGDILGILSEDNDMSITYQLDANSEKRVRFTRLNSYPQINDRVQFNQIIQPELFAIAVFIQENSQPQTDPTTTRVTTQSTTTTTVRQAQPAIVGATGLRGPIGEKGDRGEQGLKGSRGISGEKGNSGEQGRNGERGNSGLDGQRGDRGDRGLEGVTGPIGLQGNAGQTGPRGFKGDTGTKGDRGQIGNKGSEGDVGSRGQDGIKGQKGNIGTRGDRGDRGHTGPYGATGIMGSKGSLGEIGPQGFTGVTGPSGLTGPVGPVGSAFQDRDECETAGCSDGCMNTLGSYYCTCSAGYQLRTSDNKTCMDANECGKYNGGCQETCKNTIGSFECSCPAGFVLSPNRRTCKDVDECKSNDGGCADDEKCINVPGSRRCIPKVIETVVQSNVPMTAALESCESGSGLLSRMTMIGFIVWLIILSVLIIITLACLFMKKSRRRDDFRYRDDVSRRYSEAWEDQRSHKSAPYSSRLPEVNYY